MNTRDVINIMQIYPFVDRGKARQCDQDDRLLNDSRDEDVESDKLKI